VPPPGYEPFLRAICANPEDDTVRLVYADWLDENGDPDRAEFIRLQVAVPDRPPAFDATYARIQELRRQHGAAWRNELPRVGGVSLGEFRRGFVNAITFQNGRFFVDLADRFLAEIPACDLRVLDVSMGHLPSVLASPHAAAIQQLRVHAGIHGDAVLELLSQAEQLRSLNSLTCTAWGPSPTQPHGHSMTITDRGGMALVSARLPKLHVVSLSGAQLSGPVIEALRQRFGGRFWAHPCMSH
jgi:uncharacterized protein (TIGR02996 family)